MSYSFQVSGADKAAAKAAVAAKMDEVVVSQASHARDKAQALAAADAFIDVLADDADKDVGVTMHGSLSGRWEGSDVVSITGANVSVSAYLKERAA